MTTIAYHHASQKIAVDGRVTAGSLITTDKLKKWIAVGDDVWFMCGTISDFGRFISYHSGELSGKPEFQVCCSAVIVTGGECYEAGITEDGEPWRVILSYDYAVGSGRDFAISAMDLGMGAEKAVAHAATRDNGTGGKISVFDLATMSFVGEK